MTDDEGNSYDIEMQTTKEHYLAKRTRYYHSEMDGYQIKKGQTYDKLSSNIVIFICTYDPFGYNESLYKFETVCRKHPECNYDDGILSIFLNITGNMDDIAEDLKNVLVYLRTGEATDSFTKDLDNQVKVLNNDTDWRDRQMTFEMKLKEYQRHGFEEGAMQQLHDSIRKMLSKGFSPKEVMDILECSETDIEEAQKQ